LSYFSEKCSAFTGWIIPCSRVIMLNVSDDDWNAGDAHCVVRGRQLRLRSELPGEERLRWSLGEDLSGLSVLVVVLRSYCMMKLCVRLKTHGTKKPKPIFDSDFRLRKQSWPKKMKTTLLLLQLCIYIITPQEKENIIKMYIHRFCTVYNFTNKPNENNELQPITTVSVDHVLLKIDLEIEHVLIRVDFWSWTSESFLHDTWSESQLRFYTLKIGAGFRARVSLALLLFLLALGDDPSRGVQQAQCSATDHNCVYTCIGLRSMYTCVCGEQSLSSIILVCWPHCTCHPQCLSSRLTVPYKSEVSWPVKLHSYHHSGGIDSSHCWFSDRLHHTLL